MQDKCQQWDQTWLQKTWKSVITERSSVRQCYCMTWVHGKAQNMWRKMVKNAWNSRKKINIVMAHHCWLWSKSLIFMSLMTKLLGPLSSEEWKRRDERRLLKTMWRKQWKCRVMNKTSKAIAARKVIQFVQPEMHAPEGNICESIGKHHWIIHHDFDLPASTFTTTEHNTATWREDITCKVKWNHKHHRNQKHQWIRSAKDSMTEKMQGAWNWQGTLEWTPRKETFWNSESRSIIP